MDGAMHKFSFYNIFMVVTVSRAWKGGRVVLRLSGFVSDVFVSTEPF